MFDDYNDDDFKSHEEIEKMPIYKKAWEIMVLGRKIGTIASNDEIPTADKAELGMLKSYASYIVENALIIPAKIAGAEGADLYDIRMENASIIRKAAREIMTSCTGLQICGYQDDDYIQLLRGEIEEFRILFAKWVKTFDQKNYIIDRWGLFNPPGINYDDYDPDDDIPFDSDDIFE